MCGLRAELPRHAVISPVTLRQTLHTLRLCLGGGGYNCKRNVLAKNWAKTLVAIWAQALLRSRNAADAHRDILVLSINLSKCCTLDCSHPDPARHLVF